MNIKHFKIQNLSQWIEIFNNDTSSKKFWVFYMYAVFT